MKVQTATAGALVATRLEYMDAAEPTLQILALSMTVEQARSLAALLIDAAKALDHTAKRIETGSTIRH